MVKVAFSPELRCNADESSFLADREHTKFWGRLDLLVGRVVSQFEFLAEFFIAGRTGALGIKKSSAQITKLYSQEELKGKQIIAVVNFPPRQIATFISEVLVLGVYGNDKEVILLQADRKVENGSKIG